MGVEKNVIWGVSSTTVPLPLAGLHLILLADLLFFHSNLSFSFVVTHQDQREYLVSGAAAPGRKRSIPLLLYWPLLWLSHHLRTPQPECVRLSYMPYTHTCTHTHTHPSGWLQLFYLLCFVFKRAFKVHVNLFSPVWKCSGTCGHSVICPWGWSWPSQLQKLSSLIPKPEVTSSFFAQWQFLVFSPTWCLYTVVCC